MSHALALPVPVVRDARDRDSAGQRVLAFAIAMSLLIHGAAVWEWWPRSTPVAPETEASAPAKAPLTASLVQQQRETEAAAAPPPPAPPPRAVLARARPPVLLAPPAERRPALPELATQPLPMTPSTQPPAPAEPVVQPPATTPPVPTIAQTYPDLSSYVAARRRSRGESESSSQAEDETTRRNRIVSANLASINTPTFGAERRNSGGMFQITQLGADSAEFTFFGWNRDIKRRASQRIDVRRGEHGDIRLAIVRKMIAIIREHEQEDFTWRSNRLARDVTLSARPGDNEGLEQFMLREFFDTARVPG